MKKKRKMLLVRCAFIRPDALRERRCYLLNIGCPACFSSFGRVEFLGIFRFEMSVNFTETRKGWNAAEQALRWIAEHGGEEISLGD